MLFNRSKPAPSQSPDTGDASTVLTFDAPSMTACVRALETVLTEKKAKGAAIRLYLENFKEFNDTFGHDYGDLFLQEVFTFLTELEGAQTLRCAGAEFVVILQQQSFSQAANAARLIQNRFEEAWHLRDMDYMCAMSLGMLLYPEAADNAQDAMKCLEYAVSDASQRGQNMLSIFNSELRQKLYRRSRIAQMIPDIVKNGGVEVRYRPTFHVESQTFTRAECYLRLMLPEFGAVGAAEFIPIAEDSGQICAIGSFAIEMVCRDIRDLLDAGVVFESLAIAVSPVQFLQESFMDEMQGLLLKYEIPPHKLAFEITESVLVNSISRVLMVMQELSDMGVEFVLNEFGTGYSGINNILDLPIDVLKLERMFVWQLETNPRSGVLVEGLIQIAHKLDLKLVAEGVETENQVTLLREYGCRYEQGFYYSPTVTRAGVQLLLGKGMDALSPELSELTK